MNKYKVSLTWKNTITGDYDFPLDHIVYAPNDRKAIKYYVSRYISDKDSRFNNCDYRIEVSLLGKVTKKDIEQLAEAYYLNQNIPNLDNFVFPSNKVTNITDYFGNFGEPTENYSRDYIKEIDEILNSFPD